MMERDECDIWWSAYLAALAGGQTNQRAFEMASAAMEDYFELFDAVQDRDKEAPDDEPGADGF